MPGEETPIQMTAEVVRMTVRPATEADNTLIVLTPNLYGFQYNPIWFQAVADVEADFTMKNPTGKTVSVTAWFPLASTLETNDWSLYGEEIPPRIDSFRASIDGEPAEWTLSDRPNPKGSDKAPLPWVSFLVTFPGGEETVIHISYSLPLQPFGNMDMALYYVHQTGAGWAGPIGSADVTITLPYPASAGTVTGIPPGSLRLPPYYKPSARVNLQVNSGMTGNQVHLWWRDFEPELKDDIALWLLQPGKWQEIETARLAVQANPEDGRAWLDLGSSYYYLLGAEFLTLSIFSPTYLLAGMDAYQKAAALLPKHPAPHAGLALFSLEPYLVDRNAPSDVLRYVQDEYLRAKELDARDPSLMEEAGISRGLLFLCETALDSYYGTTAPQEKESTEGSGTEGTTDTVTPALTTETSPAAPVSTETTQPTRSPSPPATPPATEESQPGAGTGGGLTLVIAAAAGVIGLAAAGYLLVKRSRKKKGNQDSTPDNDKKSGT